MGGRLAQARWGIHAIFRLPGEGFAEIGEIGVPHIPVLSSFGFLTLWCGNRRVIFSESRFPCGPSLDFYEQRPSGSRC